MTDPITPATIVGLRELDAAATPVPWAADEWYCSDSEGGWAAIGPHHHAETDNVDDGLDGPLHEAAKADAVLIAAMRNALPTLLDQLAAQGAEIERVRAELSESEKRVTAIVVIGAILGSDWFCEQADGAERPSWSDALDIVRKLKGERNAAQARVADLERELADVTNGAQCRMEERDLARREREDYKRRLIEAEDSLATQHRCADKTEARVVALEAQLRRIASTSPREWYRFGDGQAERCIHCEALINEARAALGQAPWPAPTGTPA